MCIQFFFFPDFLLQVSAFYLCDYSERCPSFYFVLAMCEWANLSSHLCLWLVFLFLSLYVIVRGNWIIRTARVSLASCFLSNIYTLLKRYHYSSGRLIRHFHLQFILMRLILNIVFTWIPKIRMNWADDVNWIVAAICDPHSIVATSSEWHSGRKEATTANIQPKQKQKQKIFLSIFYWIFQHTAIPMANVLHSRPYSIHCTSIFIRGKYRDHLLEFTF